VRPVGALCGERETRFGIRAHLHILWQNGVFLVFQHDLFGLPGEKDRGDHVGVEQADGLGQLGNLLPYFCPNCLGSGLIVKATASNVVSSRRTS